MSKTAFNPLLSLKGMVMGMAEVVPGVSGGTIAFITGIYETLIDSIKSVDLNFIKLLVKGKISLAYKKINGDFLVSLMVGMVLGVIIGVFAITHLIETYPEILWAFFFGLIIGSSIYIIRQIEHWNIKIIVVLFLGIVIAYYITIAVPVQGSMNPFYIILCGGLAISALILPGISGSFILLLLGMYTVIIPEVKNLISDFSVSGLQVVALFAIGAALGLISFSRILSWTFKNHRNTTLALLAGFMIGSLNKIWPWRIPQKWIDDSGNYIIHSTDLVIEDLKLISEKNVMFYAYPGDNYLIPVIISVLAGIGIVLLLDNIDRKKNK